MRRTSDNPNAKKTTTLEVHFTAWLGDVSYEGSKSFVCENLMIDNKVIYTADLTKDPNFVEATTVDDYAVNKWKNYRYYSVWYSKRD